ncbi:helix-turn-helix domain-containing protein [Lacrimispora sp.]|uniref:helix-turn-helix domain-containing protein n=1 Tax=Lacrimispora sp. TaxID=2719234 RepID=UPI0028A6AA1B|nr:helix-turn-helix transcriptional regulator [Lacrimispora sp.]
MQIGCRLSELRKRYGYTQKQLAEEINLSQQVISNIERNATTPDVEFLQGVADLYMISLDELVGRKVLLPKDSSYEKQILSVLETMDDTMKELSLRLLNEVAQHRGEKDGK